MMGHWLPGQGGLKGLLHDGALAAVARGACRGLLRCLPDSMMGHWLPKGACLLFAGALTAVARGAAPLPAGTRGA